ncbi:MAG TPA: hypothetical protein VIM44_04525 [Rariglobus sp.]
MIHPILTRPETEIAQRMLAVVAGRSERAREVAAQFAAEGDAVETIWYKDSHQLISDEPYPHFAAVILFAEHGDSAAENEEAQLRKAMTHTPVFRVA